MPQGKKGRTSIKIVKEKIKLILRADTFRTVFLFRAKADSYAVVFTVVIGHSADF